MLKNYLIIISRNIIKQKAHSFINIAGLAIGFAACIIITIHTLKELNYDRHFKDNDLLFRVVTDVHNRAGTLEYATTPSLLAPALKNEYPQVKYAARLITNPELSVRANDKSFVENRIFHVDPDFFKIFSFEFVNGDPGTCLDQPKSVVITDVIAKKYFGEINPLGKILDFGYSAFKITGVVHSRYNSHLKFDFLLSFKPYESGISEVNGWTNVDGQTNLVYTYIKLEKNCNAGFFENQIKKISQQRLTGLNITGLAQIHSLQPIKEIHLNSQRHNELDRPGDKELINIFAAVAFFIMVIACLNYIILTTSKFSIREKEIGIRKTFGAVRFQLVKQFFLESLLFGVLSFAAAIGLVEITLPVFNSLLGITLQFEILSPLTVFLFAASVIISLLAGIYPAFVLTTVHACKSFKDNFSGYLHGNTFRKILVVSQFALSIILITGTIAVYKQINFMKNTDVGYDRDKLIVLPVPVGSLFDDNSKEFISGEFKKIPSIVSASSTSFVPGMNNNMFKGNFKIEGRETQSTDLNILMADHDFLKTYGIKLLSGRDFQKDRAYDLGRSCFITESALKKFNWNTPEEAIGKYLYDFDQREIIGVVGDFHYRPLQHKIEPLFIAVNPDFFIYLTLKFNSKNIPETIYLIKNKWTQLFPNEPFEYYFLSDIFDAQYKAEESFNKIILIFSALAIFIACLGLYGLTLLNARQKIKEIGIRKVLGASVSGIVSMLSKDFFKWILTANIIAWPLAYYFMNKWLEDFAYRIEITWWMFALAGGIALVIALLTVSSQAIKAATANPVESLRYE